MSGILYINSSYLEAAGICKALEPDFDISLNTNYADAHHWIRMLDPDIILVRFDAAFPRLPEMLGHFLTRDDRHRVVVMHGAREALAAAESMHAVGGAGSGGEWESGKIGFAGTDIPSIRKALEYMGAILAQRGKTPTLHGVSRSIIRVNEMLEKYARSEYPVLIRGESGTGKEIAARRLHGGSNRRDAEMVSLDCGALPEALIETTLFGSERGAFTDATDRRGAIEEAERGTLFLDEIGNLPLQGQCKLLRVLESGDYRRLGGKKNREARFRLVSATSLDLGAAATGGVFRKDLYHRINTLILDIPPLRERKEDIEPIAIHLCLVHSEGRCIPGRRALEKLLGHDWPGNIRELRNTIQRGIVLSGGEGELDAEDIVLV